jgi:hypothetical protein
LLIVKSYQALGDAPGGESGKFVLLVKGNGLHLVLSPLSLTPYHINIVHRYLQMEGRGEVEIIGMASGRILSRNWTAQGGGYYRILVPERILSLYGKSTAFGKYRAALLFPHASEISTQLGLTGFTLEME